MGRAASGGAVGLASVLLLVGSVEGQGVRARATTTVRYVELQPVEQLKVARERVSEGSDGSLTFEGRPVTCLPGLGCTYYDVLPVEHAVAGTQDVALTAWGLGVRGLSMHGLVRGRIRFSGEFVWPRSDDAFDWVLAYGELARDRWRIRLGRQETLSGLGFQGYDGANARWTPFPALALEGYAGRSLVRGLSEPHHEALRGLEDFIPDRNAYVFGGFARFDAARATSLGLRYQREIWSDRSALLQERMALDAHTGALAPLRVEASFDWDVAGGRAGSAHLTLAHPLPAPGLSLEATLRRYLPYFPLHTIWGFFQPVPYHEGVLRASAAPLSSTSVAISGAYRRYGDTGAQDFLSPLTDHGWRGEAWVRTVPSEGWRAELRYGLDWGAGAFLSALDASATWRVKDGIELGANATAFQQILEFRVGDGRVWGAGVSAGVDVPWGARLDGGAALYRHGPRGGAAADPWNQTRAWTVLFVPFGRDPGASAGGGLRR